MVEYMKHEQAERIDKMSPQSAFSWIVTKVSLPRQTRVPSIYLISQICRTQVAGFLCWPDISPFSNQGFLIKLSNPENQNRSYAFTPTCNCLLRGMGSICELLTDATV